MAISDVNKLAEGIRDSAVPEWLHAYLDAHRDRILAELKLFGESVIPTPEGEKIVIRPTGRVREAKTG